MPNQKKLLIFLLIFVIISSISIYFYFQKENQKQQQQAIQELLKEFNEAVNLMDSVKDKMPKELLEVHQFLIEKGQKNEIKFAQIPTKLKDFILLHGAKYQILYADPTVKLKPKIWIPLFYHEAGHLYRHQEHPVANFEEFQKQLFDSEIHSYTVDAQSWNIVQQYFPVKKEELTEKEQKLFDLYSRETSLFNKMINGDSEAEKEWREIVKKDIETQRKYQDFFEK